MTSSSISNVGFEPDGNGTGTLSVEFTNGKVYEASGVAAADHEAFMRAESVGGHFNNILKKNHLFKKVGG